MAVPARHERCIEARHSFILNDKIFKDFVYNGTHMDIAVSIGRAVVQYVKGGAAAGLSDFGIDIVFGPLVAQLRLTLRQVSLHRKACLRQVKSIPIAFVHFV